MNIIQKFIIENVEDHPVDIVKVAQAKFDVSKTAIFKHIQKLKELNIITQKGTRNKTTYYLSKKPKTLVNEIEKKFSFNVGDKDEDEIWRTVIRESLGPLKQNVLEICKYGFTEMFNNVIDHSESKRSIVVVETSEEIKISIMDYGIGVFKKIATYFNILDLREAVIRLHQGKVTTDKTKHTGQGIFFTSRAFDQFYLAANGYAYIKDNSKQDDWYWESQNEVDKGKEGTFLELTISKNSSRILKDVFDMYTNDDFSFDKSHIRIQLGKYEEDSYVSRSQAKRLLAGLGKFRIIILDFKNIRNVGQGFVDEVFGVFGLEHPEIHFIINNANEDILFMIRRGLKDREISQSRISIS